MEEEERKEEEEEIERIDPLPDVRVMEEILSEERLREDGYLVNVIKGASVSVIDVIEEDEHVKVPYPNERRDVDIVTLSDAVISVLFRVSVPLDVIENRDALHVDVSVIESVSILNDPVLTLASVFDPLIVSFGFDEDAFVIVTLFVRIERVFVDGKDVDPAMQRMVYVVTPMNDAFSDAE